MELQNILPDNVGLLEALSRGTQGLTPKTLLSREVAAQSVQPDIDRLAGVPRDRNAPADPGGTPGHTQVRQHPQITPELLPQGRFVQEVAREQDLSDPFSVDVHVEEVVVFLDQGVGLLLF